MLAPRTEIALRKFDIKAEQRDIAKCTTQQRSIRMDDYTKFALDIVKAQAGVRVIDPEEFLVLVKTYAAKLRTLDEDAHVETASHEGNSLPTPAEAAKSIKEKSVTCLECGKKFKIITKKHLATHGLTKKEYMTKFRMNPKASLAAKELVRARSVKMQGMKLWERKKNALGTEKHGTKK